MQRVRAQLDKVSLCRYPAYEAAQVLAMREDVPAAEPATVFTFERSADVDARLAVLGFEPLHRVATTEKPWDGSPARFTDEQYERSTLFCRPGDEPPKQRCSLPVLEPDGTLNTGALGAAAAVLAGARGGLANVSREQIAAAARKLIRYYTAAKMRPPEKLVALART